MVLVTVLATTQYLASIKDLKKRQVLLRPPADEIRAKKIAYSVADWGKLG